MVFLGLANATFGVLALTTDMVRLSPTTSGGLLVAGVLTALTGILVWGGSRLALALALTVFVILLVLQIGDLAGSSGPLDTGLTPRLVVLTLLVAALATAQLRRPRRRP